MATKWLLRAHLRKHYWELMPNLASIEITLKVDKIPALEMFGMGLVGVLPLLRAVLIFTEAIGDIPLAQSRRSTAWVDGMGCACEGKGVGRSGGSKEKDLHGWRRIFSFASKVTPI